MASSSSAMLLTTALSFITYMGIVNVVAGILGNLLNIIVFLSLKTFRQSSCAFYLTLMSFANIGHLILGQLSRVMITGYGIDFTATSLFYCKFRAFIVQVCPFMSFTCLCFATIDQFLATCNHVYWHRWSNIKIARPLSLISVVFWIIYDIPYFVFYDQVLQQSTGKITCGITDANFRQYHTYMNNIILSGGLPLVITVLFGSLAYRNVRQISYRTVPLVRRELDKQLTNMVLIQIVFSLLSSSYLILISVVLPYITTLSR